MGQGESNKGMKSDEQLLSEWVDGFKEHCYPEGSVVIHKMAWMTPEMYDYLKGKGLIKEELNES